MNFKKNKFYFQSLVISIGLLLHLTGFNVFAGPGDDFAQAPTAGPGKELVPVSPCTYTAGSKDLGKDLSLALQEIDIPNFGEYLAPASQGTDTVVPGNSGENLAPALPGANNVDLEKQVAPIPQPIPQINTSLMSAAKEGDFDMVKQFYENGADVNQKDESGDTPFMLAYKNGHKQIENFLLEKMASTNKSAKFLLTIRNGNMDLNATKTLFNYLLKDKDWGDKALSLIALKEICEKPSHKTFTLGASNFDLLDNMAKCTMLRMKYTMLDEAFVKKLTTDSLANVLQGTNTAVPGNSGENLAPALPDADNVDFEKQVAPIPQIKTPLMNAAEEGNFHIVQQLYENGADVNQKDESGDTPFMFAYKNDHKQIENFLLEKMASTNKSAEFLLAIRNGNMDLNATKTLFNYLLKDKDWDDKVLSLIALKEIFEKPSHKTFTLGDSNFDLSDNMMKCAILGMKHTPIDDASVKKLTDSLADVLQDTDTAVPGNSGENLAPALPDADNLDLEKQVAPIPQIKTPLMNAAEEGDFHIVQQLYENGADVNQKDESGDTPFMFAYKNDHKQIENFLLEKMASTNKSAEFLLAIRNGNMDLNATKTLFNYLLKDKDWDDKALSLIALKEIFEKPSHKTFTLGDSNFDLSDNMMKCAILRMKHTMIGDAFVEEFTDSLTDCIYEIKKVKQRSL